MGRGFDVNSALGMPLLRQAGYQAGRQVDRERVSGRMQADLWNYPNMCVSARPEAANLCNCPKKPNNPNANVENL